MAERDAPLPNDARLYDFKNYQSVFPMPEWGSLAQWKREREKIRRHLWLCTGLNAQTQAFRPKARVVSKFEHEGLVVENIQIETLPGLYVMGNLYRPGRPQGRLPIVLHPHGHGMRSRTVPRMPMFSVPHRAMNMALNGMISFAWSMVAHDEDTMQFEHRALLKGDEKELCNVLGLSVFGLQLHNGMKILDTLLRRKDVDPKRVGCTGESGGATQTYYLAALDDRIRVAAPCVMLSGHYQGGCVCENAPHLHLEYSTVHYAALIAPRPLLLTGCTGDWTHHAREREYASLRKLYRLYRKEEALDLLYQDERHNYNTRSRERVYAWMTKWLKDDSFQAKRIPEKKTPVPASEKLLVHDTPVPPEKGAIRSLSAVLRMWRGLHEKADSAEDTLAMLQLQVPNKADLLVRNRTPAYASISKNLGDNRIDYGRFSEGSHLSARFVLPEEGQPTTLILRDWASTEAWQRFVSGPPEPVKRAIHRGEGLIVPMLFGQDLPKGLADHRAQVEASYLYSSYNRTVAEHRAGDVLTTVGLAERELGVETAKMRIVSERGISLIALVAWAVLCGSGKIGPFAGDFRGVDFTNPSHWVRHAYWPLILRGGGLKGLSRLCGRRKGLVSGVKRGRGNDLPTGFTVHQKAMGLEDLLKGIGRLG